MIDAPIFPCHPETKAPLVATGFKAATRDPAQIERWWKEYPNALIGVPTGAVSGFDALDIDPRHGGLDWLKANERALPRTRVHKTRSGGLHLLFRATPGLRNSAGLLAPGVDVRAEGGYVIWWPSAGFDAQGPEPAEWPSNVLVSLLRGQPAATDGGVVDVERRCPPSHVAVVDLLNRLPNPQDCDRDTYCRVMAGAAGCLEAICESPPDGDSFALVDDIRDAAIAWAERWPGYEGGEEDKWDNDWSRNAGSLAGWQTLQRVAAELIPGYAEERQAERLQEAQQDFEPLPDLEPLTDLDGLQASLGVPAWLGLGIERKTRYLGDLLASATRLFLIGATGLGKSQVALAAAMGVASGNGFLHWTTDGPARVLFVDGEMSTRLIQQRLRDALRRHPQEIPAGNLTIFAMDRAEEMVAKYPGLGKPGPLNTPGGQQFMRNLVQAVKPRVVIFDNLMSLVTGDQTTEIPWSETEPLRKLLVSANIAQVWLDHTGNDRTRQYGSSTKRWGVDAVGIMSDVEGGDASPDRIQFRLSFSAPHGKARERCKENWMDFADHVITMEGEAWRSERLGGAELAALDRAAKRVDPKPASVRWHEALQTVLRVSGTDVATADAWLAEGVRVGLTEAPAADETRAEKEAKRLKFSRAKSDLVTCAWILVDGDEVRDGRPDLDLGAI